MSEVIHKCLIDIESCILEVESYYMDNKTYDYFVADKIRKKATERNFEIIGEAMNRTLKVSPDIRITNAHRIVALRNIIIHGYDNISDENIWAVVVNHIPILKKEVQTLIQEIQE